MREQGFIPSEQNESLNETPPLRAGSNRSVFVLRNRIHAVVYIVLAGASGALAEEADDKQSMRSNLSSTTQRKNIIIEEIPAPPPLKKRPPSIIRVMSITMYLQTLQRDGTEHGEELKQAMLAKRSMDGDPAATQRIKHGFEKRSGAKTGGFMGSVLGNAVLAARYKRRLERTVEEYNQQNLGVKITFEELDAAIGMLVKMENNENAKISQKEVAIDETISATDTSGMPLLRPVSTLQEIRGKE